MKTDKARAILRNNTINRINLTKNLTHHQKRVLRQQIGLAKVSLALDGRPLPSWGMMTKEKRSKKTNAYNSLSN